MISCFQCKDLPKILLDCPNLKQIIKQILLICLLLTLCTPYMYIWHYLVSSSQGLILYVNEVQIRIGTVHVEYMYFILQDTTIENSFLYENYGIRLFFLSLFKR